MRNILIFILFVHYSVQSFAGTYYISNLGNDSNNGTSTSTPWQTLAKVNATTFTAGDQILFQKGSAFYGSILVNNSGAAGNPITFGAYGTGANPIITGFTTVMAWTNLGNNIWESTNAVSSLPDCNMVTVNGVNTAMGRYPNADAANGGYLTFQSHSGYSSITSSSLTGTPNWTGAEVVIRIGHYLMNKTTITSQSTSTLSFALSAYQEPGDGNGFFIQNDSRTLDSQNEWYYNPTTHKLQIYSISQPVNVNIASIEKLVQIQSNYLKFDNIEFTGANGAVFYCWDASPRYNHVSIKNCSFTNIGVSAINVLIEYLTLENSIINQVNSSAISTGYGNHIYMRNNVIQNIGLLAGMRNQIYFGINSTIEIATVSGFVFEYNTIKNVGYIGINFYGDSIRVSHNYVDDFCSVLDDGGGIYTYTGPRTSMTNVVIDNNIVVNGIGASNGIAGSLDGTVGIYLDERSKNCEVSYNSIADIVGYGIFLNTSAGNINVHHNTVYNASNYQYYSTYWGTESPLSPPTGNQVMNNIFVAKTKDGIYDSDPQKCISFYFTRSDPTPANDLMLASTTLDNNIYARPIADDKVIRFNHTDWNPGFQTLSEWQSYSGQDANSHKSPQTITSESDLQFEYNATTSAKPVALSRPMMDVKGTKYSGTITLQPFTSIVLMKDYNPIEKRSLYIYHGSPFMYHGKLAGHIND